MTSDTHSRLDQIRRSAKIPGCSVALVSESEFLWSRGFGLADVRQGRPATPESVYHLFSGTKLFTATAILKLVEEGLVDINESVAHYLPEYAELADIQVVHLLTHRSGLKDTLRGFLSVYFPGQTPPSSGEALSAYRIKARRSGGGGTVEYRNVNYALLGEVVARVSGLTYRDYIRANILKPLGMAADFDLSPEMRSVATTGYIGRFDPMRAVLRLMVPEAARGLYRGHIGGLIELNEYGLASSAIGGLVGSVVDFGRFLQSQLGDGGAVLSRESTQAMQAMVATGQPGTESRVGMALGWKVGSAENGKFLNHEGGGAGFTSELRLYPELGLGIALAMNQMRMPRTMRTAHTMCETIITTGVPAT